MLKVFVQQSTHDTRRMQCMQKRLVTLDSLFYGKLHDRTGVISYIKCHALKLLNDRLKKN